MDPDGDVYLNSWYVSNSRGRKTSPWTDYASDIVAYYVGSDGDVSYYNVSVYFSSGGRYILPQKKWIFRSPNVDGDGSACYMYPGGSVDSYIYGVNWDSCGRSSPWVDYGYDACYVDPNGVVNSGGNFVEWDSCGFLFQ